MPIAVTAPFVTLTFNLKVIQSEAYGSNIVTVAVFYIFDVKKFDLDFWPSGSSKVKDVAPIESLLVLHVSTPGIQPRICHRFRDISSQNFDCWPFDLGWANPWAKCHQKGRWRTIHLDLPSYKISARSRKRWSRYALPNFFSFWPLGG